MKQRFNEEQIIKMLSTSNEGLTVEALCRKYGIAVATYYRWKSKYGGMSVPEAKRLKSLEEENRRLKRLVAEYALDIVALKDVVSKKW